MPPAIGTPDKFAGITKLFVPTTPAPSADQADADRQIAPACCCCRGRDRWCLPGLVRASVVQTACVARLMMPVYDRLPEVRCMPNLRPDPQVHGE